MSEKPRIRVKAISIPAAEPPQDRPAPATHPHDAPERGPVVTFDFPDIPEIFKRNRANRAPWMGAS